MTLKCLPLAITLSNVLHVIALMLICIALSVSFGLHPFSRHHHSTPLDNPQTLTNNYDANSQITNRGVNGAAC